jgi:hypothetical protein
MGAVSVDTVTAWGSNGFCVPRITIVAFSHRGLFKILGESDHVILESLSQFLVNPVRDYLVGISGEPHVSSFKESCAFWTTMLKQQIIIFYGKKRIVHSVNKQ